MLRFLSRYRSVAASRVSFCDSCAEVCTPDCRAAARRDRTRTAVLGYAGPR